MLHFNYAISRCIASPLHHLKCLTKKAEGWNVKVKVLEAIELFTGNPTQSI